jgi:hypothetical protein
VKVKEEWFRQLRFDKHNHLGLGDIRLTIGQQEEILAAMKEKESLAHDRGVIIDSQLEHIAALEKQVDHDRGLQDEIAVLQTKVIELEEIILRQQEEGAGAIDCINKLTRQIESMQAEANRNMEELCEARGEVTPLIDKAADFIGCPDDLKSMACIEVALNHANKLREELREEREWIRGLEEELEATQRELDRARGSKAALRKE